LFTPEYTTDKGSTKKTYKDANTIIFTSFRSFGGTEITSNKVLVIEDTVTVETWYNPKITANCRLYNGDTPYEIVGTPEDIENRHQYMRFKIRSVQGGA
jgi:SPP1 family predicted phage head-tail adaptor